MLSNNEKALIGYIAENGEVSRASLAQVSGLTAASVTRITKSLIDRGLIEESRKVYGSRGQPSILLQLKANGRYSFGINFTQHQVTVNLVNLAGEELACVSKSISEASVEQIGKCANTISAQILSEQPEINQDDVVGFGISMPGNFSSAPKTLLQHERFPLLAGCSLETAFCDWLAFPYWTENDATAAAIGVKQKHPDWHDFCFVHLGYGLGGGIFIDGNPYVGVNGNAGAFGVFFPYDRSRPSASDLLNYLKTHGIEIEDIGELAQLDVTSLPVQIWVERASEQLALAFLNIARCFDPPKIVLGGQLPDELIQAIVTRIHILLPKLCESTAHHFTGTMPTIHSACKASGKTGSAWIPMSQTYFLLD